MNSGKHGKLSLAIAVVLCAASTYSTAETMTHTNNLAVTANIVVKDEAFTAKCDFVQTKPTGAATVFDGATKVGTVTCIEQGGATMYMSLQGVNSTVTENGNNYSLKVGPSALKNISDQSNADSANLQEVGANSSLEIDVIPAAGTLSAGTHTLSWTMNVYHN